MRSIPKTIIFFLAGFGYFLLASHANALKPQLIIPEIMVKPGETFTVPVKINKIDNLAGVKLVMKYEKDVLTYIATRKTRHTASLMHIVNDKKPGMLIVVMAGASGVKGSDFPIIVMKFKAGSEMKSERETRINIVKAQLMSDKLKDYDYSVNTNRVLITTGKKEKSGKRASLKKDGEAITNKEKKEESEPSWTPEKPKKPVAPVSEEDDAEAGKEKVENTRTPEKPKEPVAPVSEEDDAGAGKEKVEKAGCGN